VERSRLTGDQKDEVCLQQAAPSLKSHDHAHDNEFGMGARRAANTKAATMLRTIAEQMEVNAE